MLARLGIRQKLGLLLLIPLAAVVLVMVPFTAERVEDARSAATTAATARAARAIGALIQTMQHERLLALGYLSAPSLDRSALLAQSQTAIDDAAQLRADPNTAKVMRAAAPELDALGPIRRSVVTRTVGARTAYEAFRVANTALLDALRLTNPPGADAQGLSQLSALDALMRSNEEASSVGAILVAVSADAEFGATLLTDAVTADQQNLRRFRDLVAADQSALVDTVERGQAGQRIRQIISSMTQSPASASPGAVSEALTAAVTYTGLRRLAQDRVAREITTGAQSRAAAAQASAYGVAGGALALFAVVGTLGFTVSQSISGPLRRLTRAATVVADLARAELVRVADSDSADPAPPRLAAIEVDSSDEIGELAAALNGVQATAALLLERQVSARTNVAVMFANIARRTQNLVGRQLALIDDLERNERDPESLQRLYRLDHVATRLRRSADSLLVVSGTIDQVMAGAPTPLTDVIRSALAEIEGFRAIELGEIADVAIGASLVADLRLLLAELLENATNFSPPGASVQVTASVGEQCRIIIVDNGLGMGPVRLEEENRRLVERERLDVAPTTLLGLFVVGRLARRHGLTVRLDHSQGRGVTVSVRIPVRLLSTSLLPGRPVVAARLRPVPARQIEALPAEIQQRTEGFAWFATAPPLAAIAAPVPPAPVRPAPVRPAPVPPTPVPTTPVQAATVPLVSPARAPLPHRRLTPEADLSLTFDSPTGLVRRVPGARLVEPVRDIPEEPATLRISRDPEAERDAVNDYLSGLARGGNDAELGHQPRSTLAERHP